MFLFEDYFGEKLLEENAHQSVFAGHLYGVDVSGSNTYRYLLADHKRGSSGDTRCHMLRFSKTELLFCLNISAKYVQNYTQMSNLLKDKEV